MNSSAITIKRHIPWTFFTAYFTNQIGSALTLLFLTAFLTDFMGMSPANMVTALTVARMGDLLVAFFAGAIVQKTNMRFGQFRSWLLIIMPIVQSACFLIFLNPSLSAQGKVVFVCIAYFFTSAPMNIFVVVHNSLMAKISGPNMANRLAITAKLFQGIQFATIVASIATLRLVRFFDPAMVRGFPIVAALFGSFALGGQLLMFVVTKEYDVHDPGLKEKAGSTQNVRLLQMFRQTLKNVQLWIVLVADILRQTAVFVLSAMLSYYFIYHVGDYVKMSDGLLIQSVCSCTAAFTVGPWLAKRLGKKRACIASGVVAAVAYTAIILIGKESWYHYIACTSIAAMGLSMLGTVGIQLYLDVGEYQLFKTGQDNRPYVMSLQMVPMKVGMMLSAPIVAWMLKQAGYRQYEGGMPPTMADPGHMILLIGGIAAALYGAYVLMMLLFGINEEQSKRYAAENQLRAQQAANK